VLLGFWALHYRIAVRDRSAVGEHGRSATLRRWYMYPVLLIGLLMLLSGTAGIIELGWLRIIHSSLGKEQFRFLSDAASIAVGACLLHTGVGTAQTPEQAKMWEAQRAQAQEEVKAKAERLATQRAARKANPMAWVGTLNPMTAGTIIRIPMPALTMLRAACPFVVFASILQSRNIPIVSTTGPRIAFQR